MSRKPKISQLPTDDMFAFIQEGLNQIEIKVRSLTYWGSKEHQATSFCCKIPKTKPYAYGEIAKVAASELDNNAGLIWLTEIRNGWPIRSVVFASIPGFSCYHQFCIASSDTDFCPIIDLEKLRGELRLEQTEVWSMDGYADLVSSPMPRR